MDQQRLETLVDTFSDQRLVGVGDGMLDTEERSNEVRKSPEGPIWDVCDPVVNDMPGGALNVAANICGLGGFTMFVGTLGADEAASRLKKAMHSFPNVACRFAPAEDGMKTTHKTRFYGEGRQLLRRSVNADPFLPASVDAWIARELDQFISQTSVLWIADYGKGVFTSLLSRTLVRYMGSGRHMHVILDPKIGMQHMYTPGAFSILKLNEHEAIALSSSDTSTPFPDIARKLAEQYECSIVLTAGKQGSYVYEQSSERCVHVPTIPREAYDLVGAGDTVLATLSLALSAGATLVEAAFLGNLAASIAVGMSGTAVVPFLAFRELLGGEGVKNILDRIHEGDTSQGLMPV